VENFGDIILFTLNLLELVWWFLRSLLFLSEEGNFDFHFDSTFRPSSHMGLMSPNFLRQAKNGQCRKNAVQFQQQFRTPNFKLKLVAHFLPNAICCVPNFRAKK